MVVINRLRWIQRQASICNVHIAVSRARDPDKVKYKFVVARAASSVIAPAHSLAVYTLIDSIIMNLDAFCAMDRGHKHSDGSAVVSLWLSLRKDKGRASVTIDDEVISSLGNPDVTPDADAFASAPAATSAPSCIVAVEDGDSRPDTRHVRFSLDEPTEPPTNEPDEPDADNLAAATALALSDADGLLAEFVHTRFASLQTLIASWAPSEALLGSEKEIVIKEMMMSSWEETPIAQWSDSGQADLLRSKASKLIDEHFETLRGRLEEERQWHSTITTQQQKKRTKTK